MATPQDNVKKELEEFDWDKSEDFFGVKGTSVDTPVFKPKDEEEEGPSFTFGEEEEEEPKKPVDKKEEDPKEPEEEEEEPEKVTKKPKGDDTPAEPAVRKVQEEEEEVDEVATFSDLAKDLRDRGILSTVEIKDEDELDEEAFFELQAQEIDGRVQATLESFMDEIGEEGVAYLKYLRSGGKSQTFFETFKQSSQLPATLDLQNEDEVDNFLRYYLRNFEKLDEQEAEDRLDYLEEKGKKNDYASRYFKKASDMDKNRREKLLEEQARAEEKAKEDLRNYNDNLKKTINTVKDIKGVKIMDGERQDLYKYMTQPTIKVGKKYVTGFQADAAKLMTNEDNMLILFAKLLKGNFDLADVKADAATEEVKKIKSRLKRATAKPKGVGSGGSRSLADYF